MRSSLFAPTFCPAKVAIVEASASNTQQKNMLSLPPAVTAATAIVPMPLTAYVTVREPIAVMEYCRPNGMPIASRRRTNGARMRLSSGCILRMVNRLRMTSRHQRPLMSWLMTVAHAAPSTPMWNARMNV